MYVLSEFHCVIIGLAVLKKCCQCNNNKNNNKSGVQSPHVQWYVNKKIANNWFYTIE